MLIKYPTVKGHLTIYHHQKDPKLPTILFLHDALGSISIWRDFPEKLAQETDCNYLVYDRLGHGQSSAAPDALHRDKDYLKHEAEALLKIIHDLSIEQPILFGHSDGGSIALIAASIGNHYIKSMIVEAAHIFVEDLT